MLIYTQMLTARFRYIAKLIFSDLMGVTPVFTENLAAFLESDAVKLAYTDNPVNHCLHIQPSGLLAEEGVREVNIDCFHYEDTVAFFRSNGDLPFDIFSASFFLVSRYEEYLPSVKDQYGRFQAKHSTAFKNHFLQLPVINLWVEKLKAIICTRYPQWQLSERVFTASVTFDIDVAYAFRGRDIQTTLFSASKDLFSFRFTNLKERWQVLTGRRTDPFDTYEYIKTALQQSRVAPLFFFLMKKKRTRYDRNIPISSRALKQLVQSVASFSKVGIHPSYFSMKDPGLLKEEKQILSVMLGTPVTCSRQHYLRWQLPGTFEQLLEEGITDDYSMAFAELPGFRAGTCTPFRFYHLVEEKETTLTIHPVCYMDGTFIEDLHLQPEACLEQISNLISVVKKVKGNFICIWHNHTLSNYGIYKGWRKLFEETLRLLKVHT